MPTWTPDGNTIYFDGTHGGECAPIEFIPAAGGKVTRPPIDKEFEFLQPSYPLGRIAFSPDGRTIAFEASKGGERELWLMEDFLPLVKANR